jgi:hypothetical protein
MNAGVPAAVPSAVSSVAVDHAALMSLTERMADLAQQIDGTRRRDRAETFYERVEVQPLEEFHHIVEGPLLGDTEVVEIDGVV